MRWKKDVGSQISYLISWKRLFVKASSFRKHRKSLKGLLFPSTIIEISDQKSVQSFSIGVVAACGHYFQLTLAIIYRNAWKTSFSL